MRARALLLLPALGLLFFACSDDPADPPVLTSPPDAGTDTAAADVVTPPNDSGGNEAAPDGPEPSPVTTTQVMMQFEGRTRVYYLSVPTDYSAARSYPLVMELHGNPGSALDMVNIYPFHPVSKKNAIVVYPNAVGTGWDLYTATATNPDMNWLRALPQEIKNSYNVDLGKVWVTGWSGGGFMAAQLGCRFSTPFTALAIHAGGAPGEPNNPGHPKFPANGCLQCVGGPIPTVVTHGQTDGEVAVGSGDYAATCAAAVNGCSSNRSATTPVPCVKHDGCPSSDPVEWCSIPGLGHPLWAEAHAKSWAFFTALP